jgi:diadenosine tetraphosphate (Ap4A) HIT family hydrolase
MDFSDEGPYPQSCPFCAIAKAFNAPKKADDLHLLDCIPDAADVSKIKPRCFLVLSAPRVLAFLDIMPMTRGHLLVISRTHREKVENVLAEEGRDLGRLDLPIAGVLGIVY